MRLVDAIWETRNLGVSCYELNIDTNDMYEQVVSEYLKLEERQYMVIKIPSARYEFIQYFQNQGYQFIETAITLKNNLKNFSTPSRLQHICNRCSWIPMNAEDLQKLYKEIEKGVFKTDRIYIDPEFTSEQAGKRYIYWIQDLVKQGNMPYKVIYANQEIGFFVNREKNMGIYDGVLASTYSGYEGTGMGYCVQYAGVQSAIERNAREYIGHISCNNPKVMRVLLSMKFSIDKIEYVFIKHEKRRK